MNLLHVVSVSGGLGSAEALRRTIDRYGQAQTIAVFADVKGSGWTHTFSSAPAVDALLHERYGGEARDLYRFLWQLSHALDIPITRLEDGRTIWRVFADNKAFRLWAGEGFVHKCSEVLKRQMVKKWIQRHFAPGDYSIVLGMGWDEQRRVNIARAYWRQALGWPVDVYSPLTVSADNCHTSKWLAVADVEVPAAYTDGFEHNNCGGGCVSAGQAHFAQLYKTRRDVYLYWAYMEMQIQRVIGRGVTIMKDERGGTSRPMSLYAFIPRIEAGDYPRLDWGACGCFSGQLPLEWLEETA